MASDLSKEVVVRVLPVHSRGYSSIPPMGWGGAMEVRRAGELTGNGLGYQNLARQVRTGELTRVRHGAYAAAQQPADEVERHRALISGTWPLIGKDAVLSHESAAVIHGLPIAERGLGPVQLTRAVGGHGRVQRNIRVHFGSLEPHDVTEVDGLRLTCLERTAVDLARASGYERAVAVLDAALHQGASGELIEEILSHQRRWRGIATARRASAFADGRAESVGESFSRVRMAQAWLPAPELQYAVFSRSGAWLARCDFAWPDFRLIGEFDGRIKYIGSPQQVAATVVAEKAREQAIRDAGWVVVRWGWTDLSGPSLFIGPLSRALQAAGFRELRSRPRI